MEHITFPLELLQIMPESFCKSNLKNPNISFGNLKMNCHDSSNILSFYHFIFFVSFASKHFCEINCSLNQFYHLVHNVKNTLNSLKESRSLIKELLRFNKLLSRVNFIKFTPFYSLVYIYNENLVKVHNSSRCYHIRGISWWRYIWPMSVL